MTEQGDPVRQHYVPRLLLKRFADARGRIRVVHRADFSKAFEPSYEQALFENDFYTLDTEEGRSYDLERALAKHVEKPAARALRRVIDEGRFPPPAPLRLALSQFLSVQCVRGPRTRRAVVEFHDHLNAAREALGDTRANHAYQVAPSSPANLHAELALGQVDEFVEYLYARQWQLLDFDRDCLLTGDEPLAMVGQNPLRLGESHGLGTADTVVFPVDPRHALILVRPDQASREDRRRGTTEMATIINRAIAYGCERHIVHNPGHNPLLGLSLPPQTGVLVETRGQLVLNHFSPRAPNAARNRAKRARRERARR